MIDLYEQTPSIQNVPYVYLIRWTSIDLQYAGRRTAVSCHPNELWIKYFTSSKWVIAARYLYGEPDHIEILKEFHDEDYDERVDRCCLWETRFLRKIGAKKSSRWLNKVEGDSKYRSYYGNCCWCDREIDNGSLEIHEKCCPENPHREAILCQFCDKEITGGNSNLKQHEIVCSKNSDRVDKSTTPCRYCDKEYVHSGKLAEHEKTCEQNPNKEEKQKLICPHCENEFTNPGAFKNHVDSCKDNPNGYRKEYECDYCEKIYYDNGKRKEHELYCSENPNKIEKPIKYCQYCGKGVTGPSNIVIHEKTCKLNPNRTTHFKSSKKLDLQQAKFVPLTA